MPGPIEWIRTRGSLRDVACWLFLATLGVAPWFYGGTTTWAIELINGLLGLVLFFWVASLAVDRRWPVAPRSLAIIAGVILLQGWWMALNAHAIYDSTFHAFVGVEPLAPRLPGSADYVLSLAMMWRVTALVGVIVFVADMVRSPHWLLRLWSAVVISGGAIALFGLVQKAAGARMIFWQPAEPWEANTFFATYYYHANAGAFLNLAMPAVVGLTCWILVRKEHRIARGLLAGTALIAVVAIGSNTSRMAQLVGGLLVAALLMIVVRPMLAGAVRAEKKTLVVGAVIVGIVLVAVAQAAHLDQPLLRWQQFRKQLPVDERWSANRVALSAVADAGAFGFGPGVFRAVFPHYQQEFENGLEGTWRFLHDDYLQTVLEWGWVGSLAFGALFFGGMAISARNYFRGEAWSNRQRLFLLCSLLALIGVALHAAVDFPLQILSIQLLVATYLGICWGSGMWKVERLK
jgi:hypothetical protein